MGTEGQAKKDHRYRTNVVPQGMFSCDNSNLEIVDVDISFLRRMSPDDSRTVSERVPSRPRRSRLPPSKFDAAIDFEWRGFDE